jgi:hypothetical protein
MANAKAVVVLVAVLALLQVSCTAARRHGKPGPCDAADAAADDSSVDDLLGALRRPTTTARRHGTAAVAPRP